MAQLQEEVESDIGASVEEAGVDGDEERQIEQSEETPAESAEEGDYAEIADVGDIAEEEKFAEVKELKYRMERLKMPGDTMSNLAGVPLSVVKKAMSGKAVDANAARAIQSVLNQAIAEARKRSAIARAMRQREIGRRLIEETERRTGYEVTFVARLRDTWGLFERHFMPLDGALAYATERGSAVIPQQEMAKLADMWKARAGSIADEIQADTERVDTLVESMAMENLDYLQVTAGEFRTVTVRIVSPISMAFRSIDPLLISIDTLCWNGKMSIQDKADAIRRIRQMLGDLSDSVESVRRKIAKYFNSIST
ncbi:MAG TPA: hypothetical protein DEP05_06215 [Betaproteobacteria bacterium]|nr:hypothetical protein [Betaproteobacteria bacterium]